MLGILTGKDQENSEWIVLKLRKCMNVFLI